MDGICLGTLSPAITFGPVETWIHGPKFSTVLVNGWWINVWVAKECERGQNYADQISPGEFRRWRERGWEDVYEAIGAGGADDGAGMLAVSYTGISLSRLYSFTV